MYVYVLLKSLFSVRFPVQFYTLREKKYCADDSINRWINDSFSLSNYFYYMDKLIYLFIKFHYQLLNVHCHYIFRMNIDNEMWLCKRSIWEFQYLYVCVLPNRFSIAAINCVGMCTRRAFLMRWSRVLTPYHWFVPISIE